MSGVITAVALTAVSVQQGYKSRKSQEKAMKIDEKRSKLESMRSSVEQIRQAQIQRAQIAQMGENQNVASSSGVAGGMGSAMSQATGNIAFAQQLFNLQQSSNRMRMAANKYAGNAQAAGQFANMAMMFGNAGSSNTNQVAGGTPAWSQGGQGATGQNLGPASQFSNQIGFFG